MDNISAGVASSATPLDLHAVSDATRRGVLSRLAGAAAFGGIATLVGCGEGDESPLASDDPAPTGTPTAAPTIQAVTDNDMMVLMLQLHYLQAEYYARAVLGAPLPSAMVAGAGAQGQVRGPRQVTFSDPILADMVREIAAEKIDQVVRLRAVLGNLTPARPVLNLAVDADGSFTAYGTNARPAATATVPNPLAVVTDVYASQEQFLLGAFILEDAVMTGWRGVATLMTAAANIDIAAGMLGVSAAHTGLIRTQIFIRGGTSGSQLRQASILLSDLRDSYAPVEDDRGVAVGLTGTALATADIVPADGEGEIYTRLPNLTLNVFFMTRTAATSGGFFPAGVNGSINASTANNG